MKPKTRQKLTSLPSHPLPAALARSAQGMQVRTVIATLEANLLSSSQGRLLLLLEKELMEEVALVSLERFLRYTQYQRVLLLVNPKMKAPMIEIWERAVSWEDQRKLTSHFSLTSTLQNAQEGQICLATVFDIQVHIGIDSQQPFFKAFDAIILYDVPANPGPVWSQIVELFAARKTRVIGFSSLLSEEEGKLLFEQVINTKKGNG